MLLLYFYVHDVQLFHMGYLNIIPHGIIAMHRGFTDLSTRAFQIGAMEAS